MPEIDIPNLELKRVVIIGCGFAGLKLAKTLKSSLYQVVILDRNNYHTFQPLMYQVATAGLEPDSIAYPIRKVFQKKDHFHFRMGSVERVDPGEKRIHTDIGSLEYDILVLATGAENNFFGNSEIEDRALPMKSLMESLHMRSAILRNFERALNTSDLKEREALMSFVIVGGGPTGVELAGALAELKSHVLPRDYPDLDIRRMQIHVIEGSDRLLSAMSEESSRKAEKFLRKMGVQVWTGLLVSDYDGRVVKAGSERFETLNLIWSAGIRATDLDGIEAERVRGNRLATNDFAEVAGYSDVYAIGDQSAMASASGDGHPQLGSVASQQGSWLGKNLNAIARGKSPKAFRYKDRGTMATIGRNLAVVDLPGWKFSGFFAWLVWMFVHLMLLVDFRSRLVVFVNWAWNYVKYDRGTRIIISRSEKKGKREDEKEHA